MKAIYKVKDNLSFEIEGREQKDIFEQICSCQEVFGATECGLCHGKDIKYNIRKVEKSIFYEIICKNPKCKAKLALSVHEKGGTLYPISKLKNGEPAKITDQPPFDFTTNGWHKFDRDAYNKKKAEEAKTTSKS